MPTALDQYKTIQQKIAERKASGQGLNTNKQNADAAVAQYGQENVNQALKQVGDAGIAINYTATPVTPPTPTSMPDGGQVTPDQTTQNTQATNVTPTQKVEATTTQPVKTPEQIQSENYQNYLDQKKLRLQTNANNTLASNTAVYSTGKDLFNAVKGGSMIPGSKEFTDLTTKNPNLLQEYNAVKTQEDNLNTIKTLGEAIVGEVTPPKENKALNSLVNYFTKSMDTDLASEYQNTVTNNPEYQSSVEKFNGINQQIADNNKNIQALNDAVRKKYSAGTPESLIASAIAREARPLIEQGQYLSQLQANAQADMSRIFDQNKEMFTLKQQERTDNRNIAFQLYNTINADQIRQEDIAQKDIDLKKQIALEEYQHGRDRNEKLDDLKRQEEYNLKLGLLQLGVDPTGMTSEQMSKEFSKAQSIALSQKESKIISGIKPGELIYQDGKFITAPGAQGTGNVTPNRPNIRYETTANNGGITVNVDAGYAGPEDRKTKYAGGYQCGQFVNDVAGIGVGDTLAEKESMINKDLPATPGAAFVEDIGNTGAINGVPTGHIGIVEKVYNDGSIDVVEANYGEKGKVTRATITPNDSRYKNIKGFIQTDLMNPPEQQPLSDKQYTQYNQAFSKFTQEPVVKSFEGALNSGGDLLASLKSENGPGDVGAVFQFMKTLDPSSTVREGEFALAAKSAGVWEQFKNIPANKLEGTILTDEQRKAFGKLAFEYVKNKAKAYDIKYDDLVRVLKGQGIPQSYYPTKMSTFIDSYSGDTTDTIEQDINNYFKNK